MTIFKSSELISTEIIRLKNSKNSIGFVPTMGALHEGHASLIKKSVAENQITVVSIFVNPTQFNNSEDLKKYPRSEKEDLELIEKLDVDLVFMPEVAEMYPEEDTGVFDLGGLDKGMEGKFRPGHFNGVAQIVSKLFKIIKPDNAYFGKKDFQQSAVIRYMNQKYFQHENIKIIECDIVRENDGLAMSSRNVRLSPEHRKSAARISGTLFHYSKLRQNYHVNEMKEKVIQEINADKNLKTEYFEIVDNSTLKPVDRIIPGQTTACIAVFAGNVRLIDNISF
jgi:pantoate--beta-alanine ligase